MGSYLWDVYVWYGTVNWIYQKETLINVSGRAGGKGAEMEELKSCSFCGNIKKIVCDAINMVWAGAMIGGGVAIGFFAVCALLIH